MRGGAAGKILAIAGGNLTRFLRDRSNYFFAFLLPIGMILVLGLTFGNDSGAAIGVVAGSDALSQRFLTGLEARPGVLVRRIDDVAELRERVERGGLAAGVVVPEDLGARLEAGEGAELTFYVNASGSGAQLESVVRTAMSEVSERVRAAAYLAERSSGSLQEALARVDAIAAAGPTVGVAREWVGESAFGDTVQTFDVGAGSQLVVFVFLTGLTSALSLVQSRRLGVSRRMLATPTSALSIVTGEALGRFGVSLFQGLYIMAVTWLAFGVDWGDPWGAVALLVAFSAVAGGAAMLLGAVFKTDQQAGGVSIMVGLGLALLGGAMVPLELFGTTMRRIARLVPHSWAVDGYAVLMRHGGKLVDVLPQLGVLVVFAVVLFALAAWRFRAGLAEG